MLRVQDYGSRPVEQLRYMLGAEASETIKRQARNIHVLSEPDFIRNCRIAGTRILRLDLSSLATPLSWILDILKTLLADLHSSVERLELAIHVSRIHSVLPTLFLSSKLMDVSIWGMDSPDKPLHGPGTVRAIVDHNAMNTTITLGDMPRFEPQRSNSARAKIVSIVMMSKWESHYPFFEWLKQGWASIPVATRGCADAGKHGSRFSWLDAFRYVSIYAYRRQPESREIPVDESNIQAHDDCLARIDEWKTGETVPLLRLMFYGVGRNWLSELGRILSQKCWLPSTSIHVLISCLCKGTGIPEVPYDIPTFEVQETLNGRFERVVTASNQERYTCHHISKELEMMTFGRKHNLVVQHVGQSEKQCFISIQFSPKREILGSAAQKTLACR